MIRRSRIVHAALAATALALLAACATPPSSAPSEVPAPAPPAPAPVPAAPPPPPPAPPPPPPTAASELAAGIRSYDDGDYPAAEGHLRSALEMGLADASARAQAHKYRAFMVCVNGRERACREEFRHALEADPHFALAPAEATHPVWPKVLASVKAEMARAAARKAPAKDATPKRGSAAPAPPPSGTTSSAPPVTKGPPAPVK